MNLLNDLRFGLRLLLKDKYYTLAALITLALCIGGNAAIFSMLNTLILRSLPFDEPDRIVEIYNTYPGGGLEKASSNPPIYLDYDENTDAFDHLALVSGFSANIGDNGSPNRIEGQRVTPRFFNVFGLAPELGSFFKAEHQTQGEHLVAVLSYTYWMSRYAGDSEIVGQTIRMNDQPYQILGVAPRSIEALYADAQVFVAFAWNPENVANMSRHGNGPRLYGRLKSDVSIAQAKAQIDRRDMVFREENPDYHDYLDRMQHVSMLGTLQKERVRWIESILYLLQIGALFVLAIGCVNIANLLLIRSNSRQSEFAIRSAIGGSPMAIGRQLLAESVSLSVSGSILGALLGVGGIKLINAYAMDMLPPMQPLQMDGGTLLFALGLAILTGGIVGLFPIARVFSLNLVAGLSHSSRGSSSSRASRFVSSALVCGQVSLAMALLVGAGLLIHSFGKILSQDFGFDSENVSTMRVSLSGQRYAEREDANGFRNRAMEAISEIPGVEAVGLAVSVPMTTGYPYNTFNIMGYEMSEGEKQMSAHHTWISPGYFDSLGIEILEGEAFGPIDVANSRRAILINETMAERYFPGENPIGRKLGFVGRNTPDEEWPVVIGIVKNVQHTRIDGIQGEPFVYQNIYRGSFRSFSVFIKSERQHNLLMPMVRERLKGIDPNLPFYLSGSLDDYVDDSLNNKRAVMLLLSIFAGIAVLLSSIGIYGVMAYSVSQQSREIGTRAALGADRGDIIALFMKRGLVKTVIGLAIGLLAAIALSRFMSSMLYEVEPTEPAVYAVLTVVLFAVSMLASYLPARKAARIHPMDALRLEG